MARVYHIPCVAAALVLSSRAGLAASPDYLIVHAAHLAEAAEKWAEYRAGTGRVVTTLALAGGATRERIREHIAAFAQARRGPVTPAVLLLGDAGPVPTWLVEQTDPTLGSDRNPYFATDHPYQLPARRDGPPRVDLGRVPARTIAEALAVLDKIRRYEGPPGRAGWRRRVSYVAGEGRFGAADGLLEGMFRTMVEQLVPPAYDVTLTYAKPTSMYCPPPEALSQVVLERLSEGALLFNYVGHGSATAFDDLVWNGRTIPMLSVDDVQRLQGTPSALPIAVLTCCSAGWYDLPDGGLSLAEAMLFHPAGPVAVIAGSRLTHPYANAVLQKDLTRLLLVDRVETVGELDRRTMEAMLDVGPDDRDIDMLAAPVALWMKWPTKLGGLRKMHVQLYNLLGDPATRIALPNAAVEDLRFDHGRVTGRVEAMRSGAVQITIETTRTAPETSPMRLPVEGRNDPALNAKAQDNYRIANDVVLQRHGGSLTGGRFDVALDGPLPDGAAVIKVHALGRDDRGRPVEAFDAVVIGSGPAGE